MEELGILQNRELERWKSLGFYRIESLSDGRAWDFTE